MARTINTSGLGNDALFIFGVEDDDSTLKEFVNNRTFTTTGTINTGGSYLTTWRDSGSNIPFMDFVSGSNIQMTGTTTSLDVATGICVCACVVDQEPNSNFTNSAFVGGEYVSAGNDWFVGWRAYDSGTETGNLRLNASNIATTSTQILPQNVKFTLGLNYKNNTTTTGYKWLYAPESSSTITSSNTATSNNTYTSISVRAVGGVLAGYNRNFQGDMLLVAIFDHQLSDAEFETFHNDPMGELFGAGSTNYAPLITRGVQKLNGNME